ncbi:MAG: FAD-binding and (Fe-S)-binding domain-containing protein [Acidiferrobacterales bacterium]
MKAPDLPPSKHIAPGDPALAARLSREIEGEVLFDAFSRGRYSTDASIYQVEPVGVLIPRNQQDIIRIIQIAAEQSVSVVARGGGTSQCGQTVGNGLVVDVSKHLNNVLEFNPEERRITVQPGIVLDQLNKFLKPHGLFFPIDPSTASRATIGGMAGNNSCGARSIRYGNMVHNVRAIDAVTANGKIWHFGEVPANLDQLDNASFRALVEKLRAIALRESDEIEARWPKLLRRVGGYNIDMISPNGHNMAQLLVGSEGTLAFFTAIELELHPSPIHKVLGVCHFPTFYQAMDCTQHIVKLDTAAVELIDRTMIDLARDIAAFRPTVDRFVKGEPDALLLVEFAGDDHAEQVRNLDQLDELMGSLGFPDAVIKITDETFSKAVWEVRKAGLNIMMSMKGDGKPISFIEDCAVSLEDLAEYTGRLNKVFAKHGTTGTWYAHASVGCLHVRPILNIKAETDVRKMREIAEEAFAMVREYKGSHSGEHGDGIVRSEFHEPMFGPRIVRALEEIKDHFDPAGLFNPNRIVRPPRMDDRRLFRYRPDYAPGRPDTALDWSEWGSFAGAIEMCNNNGACRKADPGIMCPSYRATGDEQHLTRGRANALRLAITGQLGREALVSDAMAETMALCVSCKGCKRECPTGVDMARMKIEFLYHYRKRRKLSLRDRAVAYLPRYAARAARVGPLLNLREQLPGARTISERLLGVSARRSLPAWRRDFFTADTHGSGLRANGKRPVVLFVDTFNNYFEPDNARAAQAVLAAGGYDVQVPKGVDGRPLCCGRTFLAAGLVDEAKTEAHRMLDTLEPYVERGTPIIGLEPSCLFTLRDEFRVMLPGRATDELAERALLLEEFLAREDDAGTLVIPLKPAPWRHALLHGHCHQKAFGMMSTVERALRLVPDLDVELIESTCCGMAGAFGFEAEHFDLSMKIGELDILPAVRAANDDSVIVADGTSCRHQIKDGTFREALHVVRVLQSALTDRTSA